MKKRVYALFEKIHGKYEATHVSKNETELTMRLKDCKNSCYIVTFPSEEYMNSGKDGKITQMRDLD